MTCLGVMRGWLHRRIIHFRIYTVIQYKACTRYVCLFFVLCCCCFFCSLCFVVISSTPRDACSYVLFLRPCYKGFLYERWDNQMIAPFQRRNPAPLSTLFHHNGSMEISFAPLQVIGTKFCSSHGSRAVMTRSKRCCDLATSNLITRWIFRQIWHV